MVAEPHDFDPKWIDWTSVGGADGQGFSERIKALEKWMRTHRGIDYNSAGPDYPHPSQKVRALYFFEGNGRLDPNGIQIIIDGGTSRGIYWLNEYTNSPNLAAPQVSLSGYIFGGINYVGRLASEYSPGFSASVTTTALSDNAYVQFVSEISAVSATASWKASVAGVSNAFLQLQNSGVDGVVILPDGLTADPLNAADGQLFWRSDTDRYRVRLNGTYYNLAFTTEIPTTMNKVPFAAKTGTYTTTNADGTITADATSGAFTITLVTAVGNSGLVQTIKKIDSSANIVTVDGNGSQTLDGVLTMGIPIQWGWIQFTSDNSNWIVTGRG